MADETVQRVATNRSGTFAVGMIVTRNGSDRHRVVGVNGVGDLIEVECVVADEWGVFAVGDREWNLPGRYAHATLDRE